MADQTPTPSKFRGVSLLELNGAEDRATRPNEIHGNPVTFAFQHLKTYPATSFFDTTQSHNLRIIDLPRNNIGHCKYSFIEMIASFYNPTGPFQAAAPYNALYVLQPAKLYHWTFAIRSQGFGTDGYGSTELGTMVGDYNDAYPILECSAPSGFPSPIPNTVAYNVNFASMRLEVLNNGSGEPLTVNLHNIPNNIKVKGLITLS